MFIGVKWLDVDKNTYLFDTLEELIQMLKGDGYNVNLEIRKQGKLRGDRIKL